MEKLLELKNMKYHFKLKNLVFYTSFGFAIIGFVATYLIAATTIFKLNENAEKNQYETAVETFVDHISQDLLFGVNHEAIRKTKSLLTKKNVSNVRISRANGELVFDSKNDNNDTLSITKTIYYDEAKLEPAFNVFFEFKQQKLSVFGTHLMPLTFVLICLLMISYIIAFFVKKQVINPILTISSELEKGRLESISNIQNQIGITTINEIQKLINGSRTMAEQTIKTQEELIVKTRDAALSKIASQVAHDIRSPLGAIEILTSVLGKRTLTEKEVHLLKSATTRINNIANDLLSHRQKAVENPKKPIEHHSVYEILKDVINEKSLVSSNASIIFSVRDNFSAYKAFSTIPNTYLNRIFSNVINNSIEANDKKCLKIIIESEISKSQLLIKIRDNGKGIPQDIIAKLNNSSFSFDKKNGNGLGLKFSQDILRKHHGDIQIDSQMGHHTTVKLSIPLKEIPSWFVPEIKLSNIKNLVVIDDDLSEYRFWKQQFKNSSEIALHYYSNKSKFDIEADNFNNKDTLYILDLNAHGSSQLGFEIIDKYKVKESSIVVSSLGCDPNTRQACSDNNIKLIDKSYLKSGL
ncbi:MAG: HAMP domain-containing histidine kinase, partial [Bdellovibrionales bacterium]|nr:HAMP domain-containing histidine kinase [Bdellovibrionales bacterium]